MTDYQEIILVDDTYFKSLLTDINNAQYSIDFESYIFEDDLAGKQLTNALCQAAKRGVIIRVLVDGIGTRDSESIINQMEKDGIKTKIYHPLPWLIDQWKHAAHAPKFILSKIIFLFSNINSRIHRKVCIIDKKIIYVGSANITEHLLTNNHIDRPWRETTVKLLNVNIDELQYAFEKAWGKLPFRKRIRVAFQHIDIEPIFRLNYSWRLRKFLYKSLLTKISHCKKRIWITNSYFVPNSNLLGKLIKARRNGVDVRILLPGKSDVIIASLASTTFYNILLKNNVLIFEYLPTMLHAKILILDNWYSVGSSNLNYRSFRHDLEVDVNIRTDNAKNLIDKQFLHDLSQSKQLSLLDVKDQSLFKKILGHLILFLRYWI